MEKLVLRHLINNDEYFSKTINILNDYHFTDIGVIEVFKIMKTHLKEYEQKPTPREIAIKIKENLGANQELFETVVNTFKKVMNDTSEVSSEFLIKETESFIKTGEIKKHIYDAAKAVKSNEDIGAMVEGIQNAVAFTMDTDLGISQDDTTSRQEAYNRVLSGGLGFGIDYIDEALGGGFYPKSLNVICSVSHGGKSLMLGHFAANNMIKGKNGIYLSLEMAEDMVWKRIDANALDTNISQLKDVNLTALYKQECLKQGVELGTLIVKEFPAGTLDVLQLDAYVKKVEASRGITLDYIVIDYMSLMKSYTVSPSIGLYGYYKKIAEELHGYAKKKNIPIITASQLNRSAYGNANAGMEAISDSLGIMQTADNVLFLIRTSDNNEKGQANIIFKKNRNTGMLKTFVVDVNYSTMKYSSTNQPEESSNGESTAGLNKTIR